MQTKVAFVTGAAGGIGRAICVDLIGKGCSVVLADRNEESLAKLKTELGPAAYPLVLDVNDATAVAGCLDRLPGEWAEVDILVNNAGHDIGGRVPFAQGAVEDWASIIETNLVGLTRVTHAILPGMIARNRGDVVNISSISAIRMVPDQVPYSASKAGVHMLTDILRGEMAETDLRVIEIMPGLTRTGIVAARLKGDEKAAAAYFSQFGMALDPNDVSRCVMFALEQPPHVQVAQMFVVPTNRW